MNKHTPAHALNTTHTHARARALKHRYRLAHLWRLATLQNNEDAYLSRPRGEYAHLRIICYGSDNYDTHLCWQTGPDNPASTHKGDKRDEGDESDERDETNESGNSDLRLDLPDVRAPGDGTIRAANWRRVPGGLPHEVVTSSERHAALCDDPALHGILGELCAQLSTDG